ncbi:inner membrane protein [Paenibacillus sp. PastF-3]|uniref:metal-dependent hydrolase n=1 Tax=Paenibacillus sp. PastF-3 TaxID=2940626 RepID=UPI002472FC92|nr:metal-dependent hydrolase [Paenibacillus sp. PastF-3]MDH6373771.1 inner membrane protein [Paenibacillus sp. PastF-3]
MMGRAHLAISTGVTISILGLADYKITVPVVAVTVVSSLLPDIDEPNSLLVSRALPTSLLRLLQGVLIALAAFVYFYGTELAPWNTVIAILAALVSFMPTRTLRNVMMILIGACLILFGQSYIPWSTIIGCLLIICALVPHRGITHSLYGVLGWTALLYFSTYTYGHALWIAGGLSYLIHLLADALTNHGIRPLPPFDFRLKLRLMSTGTMKGTLIENLCIGLTFVLVWFVFFRRVNLEHFIF